MIDIGRLVCLGLFLGTALSSTTLSSAAKTFPSSTRSQAVAKRIQPDLEKELAMAGFELGDPVFLRIIKSEKPKAGRLSNGVLEIYLGGEDGKYQLYKSVPICAASGTQGPKTKTGDRQSPEGFYFINAGRFNPLSSYHLSLNLGYPNAYDRAHGYTGDYLMIHGNCVSVGCYAMTDPGIEKIYLLARAAIERGQQIVRVHSFPFPMIDENMALAQNNNHYPFWKNLKQGWDWFETNNSPPDVNVNNKIYTFHALKTDP